MDKKLRVALQIIDIAMLLLQWSSSVVLTGNHALCLGLACCGAQAQAIRAHPSAFRSPMHPSTLGELTLLEEALNLENEWIPKALAGAPKELHVHGVICNLFMSCTQSNRQQPAMQLCSASSCTIYNKSRFWLQACESETVIEH